ncbi:Hypothetical predicted protein [Podarcis lilfordi]|uniref:Uncharacterized protein n=1 Tax=Podarcis lilfordi TaxID=74358 RepID=A0AA35KDD5_9SAUR|nr:Hypothetical predicted protein [Podarcis lilfordi]
MVTTRSGCKTSGFSLKAVRPTFKRATLKKAQTKITHFYMNRAKCGTNEETTEMNENKNKKGREILLSPTNLSYSYSEGPVMQRKECTKSSDKSLNILEATQNILDTADEASPKLKAKSQVPLEPSLDQKMEELMLKQISELASGNIKPSKDSYSHSHETNEEGLSIIKWLVLLTEDIESIKSYLDICTKTLTIMANSCKTLWRKPGMPAELESNHGLASTLCRSGLSRKGKKACRAKACKRRFIVVKNVKKSKNIKNLKTVYYKKMVFKKLFNLLESTTASGTRGNPVKSLAKKSVKQDLPPNVCADKAPDCLKPSALAPPPSSKQDLLPQDPWSYVLTIDNSKSNKESIPTNKNWKLVLLQNKLVFFKLS